MMCKFSKSCLMVFLMVFIVSSSLSALAFLPSYSTESGKGGTGLLSILQSLSPEESETSSTPEGEEEATVPKRPEGKEKDGYICYTVEEVKEMDKSLAKVEATLKDELKPFHFGLGVGLSTWGLLKDATLAPTVDMQMRWDDFILNGSVGYGFKVVDGLNIGEFNPANIVGHVGIMYEW